MQRLAEEVPAMSATGSPALKNRKKKATTAAPAVEGANGDVDAYLHTAQKNVETAIKSEWEYKLSLAIVTVLAFASRFYGISHPNQVVFDEVHFGKVSWKRPSQSSAILLPCLECRS